jgi:hypothetical protein
MESSFDRNFGHVLIHTDALAAQSATAVNAFASTAGRHIAFGTGQYVPSTTAGKHLLAHELAHVAQQGSRSDSSYGWNLGSPSSFFEREADRAADDAIRGDRSIISPDSGSVRMLRRAEHGTYVSTVSNTGEPAYLNAGEKFYKNWGHPNVKRVSTMMDVLNDLDRAKGTIDRFRIVSHGSQLGIELGMLPQIAPEWFGKEAAELTTTDKFRARFTGMKIVSEDFFKRILAAARKDSTTGSLLTTLGVGTDDPDESDALGILLRAIVDERFIADVRLDTGDKPKIANVGELKEFNTSRIQTYGKLVVDAAGTKDEKKKVQKAIADLRSNLQAAMTGAKLSFGTMTESEAATFADPFVEDQGKKKTLTKDLKKSIEEGANGPYLKKLTSVKSKIAEKTHIEIRGCNVGASPPMLDTIRGFFGSAGSLPSISAPDLYQYFYQLNTQTYGPTEDTKLEAAFTDPSTGVAQAFEDRKRIKAGEMTRVTNEKTLSGLASKYGFNAGSVRKLNPEIADPDNLSAGDVVWLVQRTEVAAGIHNSLGEFCKEYLGDEHAWPKVWAANPWLKDPKALGATDRISIPADVLKSPFASPPPTVGEFKAAIRSGQPVAAFSSAEAKPIVHAHDPKRAEAIGKWLSAQKFDPKGRSAADLSKRFKGKDAAFETARKGTYIQFLSRNYPDPADPIFPEDPRYEKHIIRRP